MAGQCELPVEAAAGPNNSAIPSASGSDSSVDEYAGPVDHERNEVYGLIKKFAHGRSEAVRKETAAELARIVLEDHVDLARALREKGAPYVKRADQKKLLAAVGYHRFDKIIHHYMHQDYAPNRDGMFKFITNLILLMHDVYFETAPEWGELGYLWETTIEWQNNLLKEKAESEFYDAENSHKRKLKRMLEQHLKEQKKLKAQVEEKRQEYLSDKHKSPFKKLFTGGFKGSKIGEKEPSIASKLSEEEPISDDESPRGRSPIRKSSIDSALYSERERAQMKKGQETSPSFSPRRGRQRRQTTLKDLFDDGVTFFKNRQAHKSKHDYTPTRKSRRKQFLQPLLFDSDDDELRYPTHDAEHDEDRAREQTIMDQRSPQAARWYKEQQQYYAASEYIRKTPAEELFTKKPKVHKSPFKKLFEH